MDDKIKDNENHREISAFCAWEIGVIGINITKNDRYLLGIDLNLDNAKKLAEQLQEAIRYYEKLESLAEQHDRMISNE